MKPKTIQRLRKAQKYTGIYLGPAWEKLLSETTLLILRLGVSFMIMTHGFGKISNYSSLIDSFPDPLSIGPKLSLISAIGSEFFMAIFLAFGFFTRFAASVLLFTMCVIAFIFHLEDPFNAKEKALVYGLIFLIFVLRGGGKWSFDYLIHSKLK